MSDTNETTVEPHHRPRILIADDEKSIANAISAMMDMSDMDTIVVNDGITADKAMVEGEADAAILDVMMPGMSGFEVLKSARTRDDRTPILMLTALTTIDDKMNGFDAGADDYLPKPFDMRELVARTSILAKQQPYSTGTMEIGGITLNMSKSMISNDNGTTLPMTDIETSVLSYLNAHRPAVRIGRLAEIASTASGSDINDGNIRLAAATATSKLRQIGSTVSIEESDGRLVIIDLNDDEENDTNQTDNELNTIDDDKQQFDTHTQATKSKPFNGRRRKTQFPWKIGR